MRKQLKTALTILFASFTLPGCKKNLRDNGPKVYNSESDYCYMQIVHNNEGYRSLDFNLTITEIDRSTNKLKGVFTGTFGRVVDYVSGSSIANKDLDKVVSGSGRLV